MIDPDMSEELKVTVVATGLSKARGEEVRVANGGTTTRARAQQTTTSDYAQMELPTVMRNRQAQERDTQERMQGDMQRTGTDDMDFLDIPAFLRRQAD